MSLGTVTKLVGTFGSNWGRIRPGVENRDIFFNIESMTDPDDFARLTLGQTVQFEEERDRANGMRAINVTLVAVAAEA